MTSQEIAERTPQQELVSRIRGDGFKEQVSLALPGDVSVDRFTRVAVTAVMQNPDLADADANSVFQSLIRCAQDGLLPDGREAALVIYNVKGVPTAQYLPMIGGYRKIAGEQDWSVRSAVVYEHDEFDYQLGVDQAITHRPPRPGVARGPAIAAYAVGAHRDGRREFEVMSVEEIEKVRRVSRSKDRGPWVDWWDRMAEKTVARRLFKKLPLGDRERVARVLAADDPAGSADVLYGPGAGQVFQVSPAAPVVRAEGAPDVADARGAAGAGDAEEPSPAASAGPGFTDGTDDAKARADEAGQALVPPGCTISAAEVDGETLPAVAIGGKQIAEVAALGSRGRDFLVWALEPGRRWRQDGPFPTAIRAWAAVYAPDLTGAESEAA